jgi:flagellar L-ring protein precursor FlgH
MTTRPFATPILLAALLGTAACGTVDRIAAVGKAPPLTMIQDVPAPPQVATLSSPGMEPDPNAGVQSTSLYRTDAKAFFRDQRARRPGDIVTVRINISDSASVANQTNRTRTNSEQAAIPSFMGLESQLNRVLPNAVNPGNLVNGSSESRSSGQGDVQRNETVNMTVAAIVTHVLPNGNLIINGRQEVRVNFEVRELVIAGVVRPTDITRDNTVQHTQIAEARISYGGRGQLTDVQQARYGQQVYDALFPW